MSFFEGVDRISYPISRIIRMTPRRTRRGGGETIEFPATVEVELAGGETKDVEVHKDTFRQIEHAAAALVPAAPGFHLLGFSYSPDLFEDDEPVTPHIDEIPIVAWRGDGYGGVEPVALFELEGLTAMPAIRSPDGYVFEALDGRRWKDQAAWEAEMLEKAQEKHAAASGKGS